MHSMSIILALQCVTYNSMDSLAKLLILPSLISFCYLIYKLQPTAFSGKIMIHKETNTSE